MQNPTDHATAQASTPSERVVANDSPNMNRAVQVRRKAAKRTLPFDLAAGELHLVPSSSSSLSPQAEDVPARKKRGLEEPVSTTTVSIALPVAAAAAIADPMVDTQPNTVATANWTLEEDAKLTRAVANTSKKKWGKEYKTNWPKISALVPGRTNIQCRGRWNSALDPNIDLANGRKGSWTAVEDSKLKDAVQGHGGKDWAAISVLVPGRTRSQCKSRWYNALIPSIALTAGREGKWAEDEVTKLKDAVLKHGRKNWKEVAALVPGRTKQQCGDRWKKYMDPSRSTVRGTVKNAPTLGQDPHSPMA
jgi:hypothetical protein